jgi:hypothetical protein
MNRLTCRLPVCDVWLKKEWRHAHGMRCLKIPNTKHFHDITSIQDAVNLYAKIKVLLSPLTRRELPTPTCSLLFAPHCDRVLPFLGVLSCSRALLCFFFFV